MELTKLSDFLEALVEQNKSGKGYQIHLNSGNLDLNSHKVESVEFGDLYFTHCSILNRTPILSFDNDNKQPVAHKGDGTPLYPIESNSNIFIDTNKIEDIEEVKEFADWFMMPSSRVANLYMFPEDKNLDGNRNVVTIGFIE